MNICDLRIEYRKNPQGLSVKIPRFSWKIAAEKDNTIQAAYTIRVCCEGRIVWDSGRVVSDQSVLVPYAGEQLGTEKRYDVELTVEDNYGEIQQK